MFLIFRALADTDADGRMNSIEFTIACKLISLKLRGLELPKVIPSNLWNSVQSLSNLKIFFLYVIELNYLYTIYIFRFSS